MAVTQEVVLNFLLEQGGKVKNSELLRKFKPVVESPDPQEKANNRELFKRFVNNIAVVKDEEGSKVVVLKKKYIHLLTGSGQTRHTLDKELKEPSQSERHLKEAETQNLPVCKNNTEEVAPISQERRSSLQDISEPQGSLPEIKDTAVGDSAHEIADQAELSNLNELAYIAEDENERRRESVFSIVARMDNAGPVPVPKSWSDGQPKETAQKPYMLPLRYAQSSFDAIETDQNEHGYLQPATSTTVPEASLPDVSMSPYMSRRQLDEAGFRSAHLKKSSKMVKVSEENKYSDVVPLVPYEHKWLVNATNGRWNHVLLGLLMNDSDLADKRDFISGFTALHWAAKSGNTEMVKLLFDLSEQGGSIINVNVRSFGGYTPLHIAAIHDHKDVIITLITSYKASVHLRDNSGKKPYHYLKKDSPEPLRFLLKDPASISAEHAIPMKRNSKVAASLIGPTSALFGVFSDDIAFHDLTKGFKKPGSLNKFFTAPANTKKKLKTRDKYPSINSLYEVPEEAEEIVGRRRPASEFFSN
ncbi:ankyrin repeat domain-containing protein SOWAHA [Pseudophryne corroboree]|uniref:ankyrin repeat domain-containing protein SOWAHA n=1 Tax=Pseudophryne corroboree TaxID=495146 RepID=UPI003081DD90